jgi:Uma2 family endonuclease
MALPLPVEPWPDGRYTVEDWLKLPEHVGERIELIDGSFVVSATPLSLHQVCAKLLVRTLDAAAPPNLEAVEAFGLQAGDDVLIPDVIVGSTEVLRSNVRILQPYDTYAVAEIVSQGNRRRDYQDKPRIYAAAGILTFLRIELEVEHGPHVEVLTLDDGRYVRTASAGAGRHLTLTTPFPVTFDPAELLGPHRKG